MEDREGKFHRRVYHGEILAAQRIVGVRVLELHDRPEVASGKKVDFLSVLSVHHEKLRDTLGLAVAFIDHVEARADASRADAEIRQLPDVRLRHRLEHKKGRGTRGVLRRDHFFRLILSAGGPAVKFTPIDRRGSILDDEIQECGDAHVLRR